MISHNNASLVNEIPNLSPIEVAVLQDLDQSPSPCVSLGDPVVVSTKGEDIYRPMEVRMDDFTCRGEHSGR